MESILELPPDFVREQTVSVQTHAGTVAVREELMIDYNSIDFTAGNKELSLWLPSVVVPEFFTLIETRQGVKQDGATTALYTRADQRMQDLVDIYGKPIRYTLDTVNQCMIDWANSRGREIFGWDKLTLNERTKNFSGAKVYEPSK